MAVCNPLFANRIKRWGIVNTAREQTVADHSYTVAVMTLMLYDRLVGVDLDDPESCRETLKLLLAALTHDATEVLTGDIPTPGKSLIEQITGMPGMFGAVDKAIALVHPFQQPPLGVELSRFIDVADKLEAACWLNENAAGPAAARVAVDVFEVAFNAIHQHEAESGGSWKVAAEEILDATEGA